MNTQSSVAPDGRDREVPPLRPRRSSPRAITDFFDFGYLRSVVRRRFWLVFVIGAVFSALGVAVAFVLPPTYRSFATILVESQQIPTELARSTVTASAVEQFQVIQQRIMTRSTLLELAERHQVFAGRPDLSPTERVDEMRAAISFSLNELSRRAADRNFATAVSFTVGVTAESPTVAAAVANELVTRILDSNAALRRARAETTADFFRQEVERLARELSQLEARIVSFQKENEQALPDSLEYRRNQLDLIYERLQRFEQQRLELEQERTLLRLSLEERSPERAPLSAMMRELDELRRALAQRQAVLAPTHPEIRRLTLSVAALEAALAEAPELTEPEAPETEIDGQTERRLSLYDARMQFVDGQILALEQQREELEQTILLTPSVEMEINALNRAYEDLEGQYRAAQARLAQATIGQRIEDRQQGERLEVIEQPIVPEEPQSPKRLRIAAAGVVAGFGLGGALALLLELISPVVRRPSDLETIDMRPLAVIPYLDTVAERVRRWAIRILAILVVFGGSAAGLWIVHTQYLPLETVAQRIVERAGLERPIALVRRQFGL